MPEEEWVPLEESVSITIPDDATFTESGLVIEITVATNLKDVQ